MAGIEAFPATDHVIPVAAHVPVYVTVAVFGIAEPIAFKAITTVPLVALAPEDVIDVITLVVAYEVAVSRPNDALVVLASVPSLHACANAVI